MEADRELNTAVLDGRVRDRDQARLREGEQPRWGADLGDPHPVHRQLIAAVTGGPDEERQRGSWVGGEFQGPAVPQCLVVTRGQLLAPRGGKAYLVPRGIVYGRAAQFGHERGAGGAPSGGDLYDCTGFLGDSLAGQSRDGQRQRPQEAPRRSVL